MFKFLLHNVNRYKHSSVKPFDVKVALILSGCGVYDGSEIHEATSCMIHLSRNSIESSVFAPDIDQFHVINHTSGKEMNEKRNVLIEAARIARGKISSLADLKSKDFDVLVIPGGFGVAKTLCDFAFKSAEFKINSQVENCIREFAQKRKPIGVCCIAPVLLSKVIPGVEVTMGGEKEDSGKWPYVSMVETLKNMGMKHFEKGPTEIYIDAKNQVVSTPAYMCDQAPLHDIFHAIGRMIDALLAMAKTNREK